MFSFASSKTLPPILRFFEITTRRQYYPLLIPTMDNSTSTPKQGSPSDYPTYKNLIQEMINKMGIETGFSPVPKDRSYLMQYLPKTQEELPKRSMAASFIAAVIPLSKEKKLQDKYITFLGRVRVGRLIEDMDMFAVLVAHKHISNPKMVDEKNFPYVLVTASVDKIDFTDFIPKPKEDIKISGHVCWVGKSSMEIVIWLEQFDHGTWQRITRALFVFAARNSLNTGSAIVNAIEPSNDREKRIFSGGQDRQAARFVLQKMHVSKVIPNGEEQKIIHDLYVRTIEAGDRSLRKRLLPPGCIWMHSAQLSNVVFSHPEQRNLHNTVFGGYIMRQAEELSWVLGYMFSKYRPLLKSISDIHFQRPIAVSSLIQMHSQVAYTTMNYIQIITYVETYNPTTGKNDTTNALHFTYQVPEVVPECIPMTYQEAMMYVDGRRHFLEVMKTFPENLH